MWFRFLLKEMRILIILFVGYTHSALQNVTVDDAVMTGAVVPHYFPSESLGWNIGNECPRCHAQPSPNQAYNGTWHDATFSATVGYTQSIEFSYTGSSLYIFFIIANTVPFTTTFTGVNFMLDGALVGDYTHIPTTSTDYEYNVPVYANDTVPFGEHSVVIQPITNLGHVLILFDYLIYTADMPSPASPSSETSLHAGTGTTAVPSPTSSDTQVTTIGPAPPIGTQNTTIESPSPDPTRTQGTYSRSAIGAIVGGTVGGTIAVILVVVLLCYRRYQTRNDGILSAEGVGVDPIIVSGEVAPATLTSTISSTYPMGSSITNPPTSGDRALVSSVTPPTSVLPTSSSPSSLSGQRSGDSSALLEQVGILRDEVARLRNMHEVNGSASQYPLEAPPEYTS